MEVKNWPWQTIFLVLLLLDHLNSEGLDYFRKIREQKSSWQVFIESSADPTKKTRNLLDCVSSCQGDPKCRLVLFEKDDAMCVVAKEEPDVPTGKILFPVDNSNPENAQTALLREDF